MPEVLIILLAVAIPIGLRIRHQRRVNSTSRDDQNHDVLGNFHRWDDHD